MSGRGIAVPVCAVPVPAQEDLQKQIKSADPVKAVVRWCFVFDDATNKVSLDDGQAHHPAAAVLISLSTACYAATTSRQSARSTVQVFVIT